VQLKYAVSKQNLDVLKRRLKECDNMIEREGTGSNPELSMRGGEGDEVGGDDDAAVSLTPKSQDQEIDNNDNDKEDDENDDDDNMPPGPPV
jgi:hypothetical protein